MVIRMNSIKDSSGPKNKRQGKSLSCPRWTVEVVTPDSLNCRPAPVWIILDRFNCYKQSAWFIWALFGWAFLLNDFIYSRESTLGASSNSWDLGASSEYPSRKQWNLDRAISCRSWPVGRGTEKRNGRARCRQVSGRSWAAEQSMWE